MKLAAAANDIVVADRAFCLSFSPIRVSRE